jgi:hypothetical protein
MTTEKDTLTRLDVSLEQYEIGLSGAIPEQQHWSEPAMDRAILEFISQFSALVFKYGGRIVHGSHPALTPIILRQARLQAPPRLRKPITLVMSDLWARNMLQEDIEALTDVAELVITKAVGRGEADDPQTRNSSLSAMREVLVSSQNVMVAVGGKMHAADGLVPGIGEEMELAEKRGLPRFLVAGLGGFARELAKDVTPRSLNNSLSVEENIDLFSTGDVSACVSVIFNELAQSEALARLALQPVKWNPDWKAILDHKDGTVVAELTSHILRAVAV